MKRIMYVSLSFLVINYLAIFGSLVYAATLPEGVKVDVIAEYNSKVPGLETVRLVLVSIEPGAGFKNTPIKSEEYCELAAGVLSRTDHDTGITDYLTVGARWAPVKGHLHTVTNTGTEVVKMWVYQLIEKGEAEKGGM